MKLTTIQDLAIQARMAGVVGADVFDHLFIGIHFYEIYDTMLYAFVEDEEKAAKIEDEFSPHIAAIASMVLKKHVDIVLVMPKVLQ
ncbi:hypothetical protein [Bradyrhizobium stylosanthis]|uniref:Uncharacterized protein n=1 Tax=Bradyrhizobium stylosanthis TaxID=1803665 RepID=A0A560D634_9BRAD|nr:hypothetical protein [Bradyrhizobium stylosanthis]TWA92572.1 hypothetical protein FBZ96_11042 [Bradyrhizobium stylosanthis]